MNKQQLIEKALQEGFEQVEIYTNQKSSNGIQVFQGNVDNFEISETGGIAVRGIYQGKPGYCFLEEDSDENIDFCVEQMKSNACAITSKDKVMIYEGDKEYPTIEKNPSLIQNTSSTQRIAFLKEMEQALLNADHRIAQVMDCFLQVVKGEVTIVNSKGLNIQRQEEYGIFGASVLASENNENKSAYDVALIYDLDTFDKQKFISTLVHKAVDKLKAIQPISGKYPVILQNNVMCDLLGTAAGSFYGENAYKGISILKDKLNSAIFDEKVTLIDDPLLKDGYSSTPFDDEGVASRCKHIVEKGVLISYLHNQKSAALMNTLSTGNGFKAGYAGSVGIMPTNFYFEKGEDSLEEMIASVSKGILIDTVTGLHAGFNTLTTDFSLQASGFMIEDGKIAQPIQLVTVAGNFMEMLKQVEKIGNDLKFDLSGCGSASMKFTSLTISGK